MKHCIIYVCVFNSFILQSIQSHCEKNFEDIDEKKRMTSVAVSIIQKCFVHQKNYNILIGNWTVLDEYILHKMFTTFIPINLIRSSRKLINRKYIKFKSLQIHESQIFYKEHLGNNFIIFASSILTLSTSLKILKQSIWWNHEGFFLLINININDSCKLARSFMQELWSFNIMSTVFLCLNLKSKLELYTFNPYSNLAPKLWNVIKDDTVKHQLWTLFQYPLESTFNFSYSTICDLPIYQKTKTLTGHIIKMGAYVHTNLLLYNPDKPGLERFGGVNGDIVRTICSHLNATADVKFYKEMGSVDDDGFFRSFLRDLQSGELDFAMNMNVLRGMWKQQTYPHETSGFCIVSLKQPVSFTEKIEKVFTPSVWFVLVSTFIISTFILKTLLQQSLPSATLEFLRMLLNVPTLKNPPSNSSCRIFFLATLILTMIINSFFQSRLSSINVVPSSSPTIDTVNDLLRSDLSIHGTLSYKELLSDLKLDDRYYLSEYPRCVEMLRRGERVACIPGCIEARFGAYESELLHISKRELRNFFMVFPVREDWPLIGTFNEVIRRLSEAGMIRLFRMREARFFMRDPEGGGKVKRLNFEDMRFGFSVLILGLLLGLCLLFVEICIYKITRRTDFR